MKKLLLGVAIGAVAIAALGALVMGAGLYNVAADEEPNLAKAETSDPARAFWIIKHGIKATGMPAWGKSMEDSYIWDMVAFIRKLPTMNPEQYAAEVAASEGHSHEHSHDDASTDESRGHANRSENASIDRAALDAVKGFHAALSAGDSAAVQRALAPNVINMEGGNVERSRDEYASHHLKSDLKFLRAMKYTRKVSSSLQTFMRGDSLSV